MNFRCSFTINHKRTHEEIMSYRELLVNNMFQGIEIFYPYQLDELGQNIYTSSIKELINGLDIEVVCHLPFGGNDNDLINNNESIVRIKKAIDYAKQFNVNKFTLHLGSIINKTDYLDKVVNILTELCSYTDKYIMVENMPSDNEAISTIEEYKYVFKKVNKKNLKLIYDTGHGHVRLKSTIKEKEFLKELLPYLMHIHISDNDSTCDMHKPIGDGNIDFEGLFNLIKENYRELFCLEIIYKDVNDLKDYYLRLEKILNKL